MHYELRTALKHFDQFHVENECAEGWNACACSLFAVGQQVGDGEAELCALLHQLNAFRPSGDDLVQAEVGRFTAFVAAVEDGSVQQTSFVVAAHGVGSLGTFACTFLQHFVLKAALCYGHAFLLCIRIQIYRALS